MDWRKPWADYESENDDRSNCFDLSPGGRGAGRDHHLRRRPGGRATARLDRNKNRRRRSEVDNREGRMVGVWTKADSVTLFDDFSYGAR